MFASTSELTSELTDYLDDATLAVKIPEFIALFEAKASRFLKGPDTISTTPVTTASDGTVTLPTLRGLRSVLNADGPISFYDPDTAAQRAGNGLAGDVYGYSVQGRTLRLIPPQVATVTLVISSKLPSLNVVTSNWLLADHPDAYLYGCLIEAEAYGFNDPRIATWKDMLGTVMDQVYEEQDGLMWGNAVMILPELTP